MFRVYVCASLLTIALWGCAKPVEFQGESTLKIAGAPPPPPAPPPPAAEPPRVEVRDNRIEIHEKIQFAYDKATILEASFSLLNEVADVIKKNPHIKKIQIEGYASSEGEARHNKKLSDERARSVMKYLVDKGGIPAERLTARGFGIDKPIADNSTEEGREKNRRVEFNIVEQDVTQRRVEIDKTGREKVLEEKKVNSGAAGASGASGAANPTTSSR
jgi:outer membrane protein OmpA-like peptidoglycan-associated protein